MQDGLIRSTSSRICRVVAASSSSEGWNIVDCSSGSSAPWFGVSSWTVIWSRFQPCDTATLRSSSVVSDSVT